VTAFHYPQPVFPPFYISFPEREWVVSHIKPGVTHDGKSKAVDLPCNFHLVIHSTPAIRSKNRPVRERIRDYFLP
jgi:hypothetical protein